MNTPNKITLARICLIPLVVFFYLADFIPWGKLVAGILFVVACFTDFLDGYLARKNNQVTTLGKFLDAIADKMLVLSALILVVATPVINGVAVVKPQWVGVVCAIIILAREFAISCLRQVAASKGTILAAEKSGKIKAVLQFISLSLYIFYAFYVQTFYANTQAHNFANALVAIVCLVVLVIAAIATIYSGVEYAYRNRQVLASKKAPEVMLVAGQQAQSQTEAQGKTVASTKPAAAKSSRSKTPAKRKPAAKPAAKQAVKQSAGQSKQDSRGRTLDELIPQALQMFWEKGWASTTMLQKHLGVGYPRASKIIDQMEELGLVSSLEGKTRRVLASKEEYEKYVNGK